MSSRVSLQVLYGTQDTTGPICSILEIDDFKILLDCGWHEPFNPSFLLPLQQIAPSIDAVFISMPDLNHMGALPYAFANFGLTVPVYGTNPTYKFGLMTLVDALQSQRAQGNFEIFTIADIDAVMDHMTQVRYRQRLYMKGKGKGIEAMAINGGRIVGGAGWKITKLAETILYAVDFGHTKDKKMLLNPSEIGSVHRPSLMITDGVGFSYPGGDKSDQFFDSVLTTLSRGGDVLIPTDASGRSLELVHQFEVFWGANQSYSMSSRTADHLSDIRRFVSCPVFFLTNVAYSTIEFAKAQLEWMNDTYADQFCDSRINIWNLKYVHLIHTVEEVLRAPKPRVILASSQSMDSGFSFELFTHLACHPQNSIVLLDKGTPGTLGELLYRKFILKEQDIKGYSSKTAFRKHIQQKEIKQESLEQEFQAKESQYSQNHQNSLLLRKSTMDSYHMHTDPDGTQVLELYDHDRRVPLEGGELEAYRARKKQEREEWEARKKAEREAAEAARIQEEMAKSNYEKMIDHGSRIFDLWKGYDLHSESMQKVRARGQHPMFPYIESRTAFDGYGELFIMPDVKRDEEDKLRAKDEEQEDDEDAPPEEEQIPTAAIKQDIIIPIKALIQYFEMEGRCDSKAFQNSVVNDIAPLKLAFVRCPVEDHSRISTFFGKLRKPIPVVFTTLGVPSDVESQRIMKPITIEHTTYKDLSFFPLLDYQVALITGNIFHKSLNKKPKDENANVPSIVTDDPPVLIEEKPLILPTVSSTNEAMDSIQHMDVDQKPTIEPQTGIKMELDNATVSADNTGDHTEKLTDEIANDEDVKALGQEVSVLELDKDASSEKEHLFIGDVKLREFKDLLDKHPRGFKTGISGAVLTVNDHVTVQRGGTINMTTLQLDGPLSETYFFVRSLLYSQLTNV